MASIIRPQARSIVVKALFSPDEYIAFDQACISSDTSHSKKLRDLANVWITRQVNDSPRGGRSEWPDQGQNRAKLLPGYGRAMPRQFRLRN